MFPPKEDCCCFRFPGGMRGGMRGGYNGRPWYPWQMGGMAYNGAGYTPDWYAANFYQQNGGAAGGSYGGYQSESITSL